MCMQKYLADDSMYNCPQGIIVVSLFCESNCIKFLHVTFAKNSWLVCVMVLMCIICCFLYYNGLMVANIMPREYFFVVGA